MDVYELYFVHNELKYEPCELFYTVKSSDEGRRSPETCHDI